MSTRLSFLMTNDLTTEYLAKSNLLYSNLLGFPFFVNLFSINNIMEISTDVNNVYENIGLNSPIRFTSIDNFPIFRVEQIQLTNSLLDNISFGANQYTLNFIVLSYDNKLIPNIKYNDYIIYKINDIPMSFRIETVESSNIGNNVVFKCQAVPVDDSQNSLLMQTTENRVYNFLTDEIYNFRNNELRKQILTDTNVIYKDLLQNNYNSYSGLIDNSIILSSFFKSFINSSLISINVKEFSYLNEELKNPSDLELDIILFSKFIKSEISSNVLDKTSNSYILMGTIFDLSEKIISDYNTTGNFNCFTEDRLHYLSQFLTFLMRCKLDLKNISTSIKIMLLFLVNLIYNGKNKFELNGIHYE